MTNSVLLRWQKNELFHTIAQLGFQLAEFEWRPVPGSLSRSVLTHRPTSYYFSFEVDSGGSYYLEYSPGKDLLIVNDIENEWEMLHEDFSDWLQSIKREIETPDLWETIADGPGLFTSASVSDVENTPFTPDEREYISQQLHEIETYLITTQIFSEEQAEFVRKRLNYLEGAAHRSGRIDWLNTAVGVIFSIMVSAAFAPQQARDLWQFVAAAFKHLLNHFPALP